MFDVANGGEAWTELRSQIEDLQFDGRDEMLRIIDTESDVNKRELKLKTLRGGKPYSFLRDKVLADQRNSGYLRIYYDYVPDTAAATINRATELINRSQYAEALQQLRTVSTDRRAYNALGVALYMTATVPKAWNTYVALPPMATPRHRTTCANGRQYSVPNSKTRKRNV